MRKILLILLLAGCASNNSREQSQEMVSMQIVDRNGFSETFSSKDRLAGYEKTDFLTAQPYQKVVRIFKGEGKNASLVTSYHSNGLPWKYLEVENGRAHGKYKEWHPNGKLKIEAVVIEGTPDINEIAQMSWLFDEKSVVFDEDGNLMAEIPYEKGMLHGSALYYFPDGKISQEIPYRKDEMHGELIKYDEQGAIVEKISYRKGQKEGEAYGLWPDQTPKYEEHYQKGLLIKGAYFDSSGNLTSEITHGNGKQASYEGSTLRSLIEFQNGVEEGVVETFRANGSLLSRYISKNGMKEGEEYEYYLSSKPKLSIHWREDVMQGVVKTWYENGILESQREMTGNKKHGLSFAWFKEGDLMLMEEYENDLLLKGSYFKKWEKKPISKVENGTGIATLYDSDGRFLKKVVYEKGLPQGESGY